MNICLLDTSALLAHYRNEPGATRVQALLEDEQVEIAMSSVSVAELARRLLDLGADSAAARSTTLEYAGLAATVVPVDTAVAVRAFEIAASAAQRIPLVDSLIAACASVLGATLVHRDPHFRSMASGLVASEAL